MISCNELCKEFKRSDNKNEKFFAVDHVSFSAQEGEIVGILGPNGAGKTTLLRMLAGIMTPDLGTVVLEGEGESIVTDASERKRKIGYISNNTKLYERLTSREILSFLGTLYDLDEDLIHKRSEEIFNDLEMNEFCDKRIGTLSTGQKQRALLARTFIHDPLYFIMDEPTLGLDVISAATIIRMMKKQRELGKCVLYSTHYMEEAENMCDRIIMLSDGKILTEGTVEEVLAFAGADHLRDAFFALKGGNSDHE